MSGAFRLNALLCVLLAIVRTCSAIPTVEGCFNSSAPLVFHGSSDNQSTANCNTACIGTTNNRLVLALSNGTDCWCGSELPRASDKGNPVFCDTPCSGDSAYICGGGTDYFTVWLTELGTEDGDVPSFTGSTTTSSASSTTSTTSASTGTANSSPTSTGNNSPTGTSANNNSPTGTQSNNNPPNTASSGSAQATATGEAASGGAQKSSNNQHSDKDVAIALGVVFGAVALALLGFIFWWVSRRRKQTGSYSRYRDSVDGSSAALQQNLSKRGPSPESSGISRSGVSNGPEMAEAYRDSGANGPDIRVQQPTPGPGSPTDSVYSGSIAALAAPTAVAAPAAAALAPEREPRDPSLRPPASREGSRASSTTDPFYTPLEQPSITHLNQAELNTVKTQTRRSSSDWGEGSDQLSPLEDIRGPQRQDSRHLPYAYSSEEDFADGNNHNDYARTPIMPGNMPGYFPVGRDLGGRSEMP